MNATQADPPRVLTLNGRWLVTGLCAVIVVGGLALGAWAWSLGRTRSNVLGLLTSPIAAERLMGVTIAGRIGLPAALDVIRSRLKDGTESDPDAREAFVYLVGRQGVASDFDVISHLAVADPEAVVRQAAWLAAARLDPERFRAAVIQAPASDDLWDQLGQAAAWVELGDPRGSAVLFRAALEGDEHQQRVACLALLRGIAPLLECVGRWPLGYTMHEGEIWPAELVTDVQARAAQLDLPRIAADLRPHLARTAAVRRNVARLTSSRERIARFLQSW
jgi:hypothetical protein